MGGASRPCGYHAQSPYVLLHTAYSHNSFCCTMTETIHKHTVADILLLLLLLKKGSSSLMLKFKYYIMLHWNFIEVHLKDGREVRTTCHIICYWSFSSCRFGVTTAYNSSQATKNALVWPSKVEKGLDSLHVQQSTAGVWAFVNDLSLHLWLKTVELGSLCLRYYVRVADGISTFDPNEALAWLQPACSQ